MRLKIIGFLKRHPAALNMCWAFARFFLNIIGWFIPIQEKTMLFASFGGRKFDDSPKVIYEEVCRRREFDDWRLIWAFVDPDMFEIPRGEKIRMDSLSFFLALLYSHVWISNSGMDRDIGIRKKGIIKVETWHGSVLKTGVGEEKNAMGGKKALERSRRGPLDAETIRCTQSELDTEVFQRLFHATKDSFVKGLPRNDTLLRYTAEDVARIREKLHIPQGKKVILYAPTWREYLLDKNKDTYIAPPMDLEKWERELGAEYVLLFRAHYAVTAALHLKENDFVRDVSAYPVLNDLFIISDLMISDYSSIYHDYSILHRPIFCFAYDFEEFCENRGVLIDMEKKMPCPLDPDEDTLIHHIQTMDYDACVEKTIRFQEEFATYYGHGSENVVDEILRRLRAE